MEKVTAGTHERRGSIASVHNANVLARGDADQPAADGWFERTMRPTKVNARYPVKGKTLLFATCAFGSLGDALFGYNSGKERER